MFRMLKLSPPHGWRTVIWELAIVTAGVLIALGVQQWAEKRSWNERRASATEAIREEVKGHYFYAVEWRVTFPCIREQLGELEARVLASKNVLDPAPVQITDRVGTVVIRFPLKDLVMTAWASALNDDVLIHFDPQTRSILSDYYHSIGQIGPQSWANQDNRAELKVLSRPIPIDPNTRYSLLRSIDQLEGRATMMDLGFGEAIGFIYALKMTPSAAETHAEVVRWGTYKFCSVNKLPMRSFDQAMKGLSR